VSEGSEFGNIPSFISTPTKIRSRYRRRLLNRLSEGGATVSVLARDIGLQVPHASAELRKLRNEGLVSSDLVAGSRGAYLHLTELGWNRIRSDEKSRALDALPLPSMPGKFCILDKDGSNLLMGISSIPKSPMILIPDRPPDHENNSDDSIGNEGVRWNWAVFKEKDPRWFDLQSMKVIQTPPISVDPGKIDTYSTQSSVIGIIRATLINEMSQLAMTLGTWYDMPKTRQKPPLNENTFHRGDWVLGGCHKLSQEIRPKVPIVAILPDSLSRTMLIRTTSINSLVIANLGGLDLMGDPYPLSSLDIWIQKAHPRLPEAELKRRVQSLKDRIMSTRKVRTDDSTWRKFRRDWGNQSFTIEESNIRNLDTRGLGNFALESLMSWVILDDNRPPLILEIDENFPESKISSILIHPKLRILVKDKICSITQSSNLLYNDSLRPLPWLRLKTSNEEIISLKLIDSLPTIVENNDNSLSLEINPWKLVGLDKSYDSESEELESGYISMIKSAISQFPSGNEEWANQMEARYPLAAWIASPKATRWPRWQRLRERLPIEWLILFDIDHIPLDRIAELADQANEEILGYFAERLGQKIREDNQTTIRTRPAVDFIEASPGTSWVAAQFLTNAAWIPEDLHDDLIQWSLEAWISSPPKKSLPALQGVSWLFSSGRNPNTDFNKVLEKIIFKAQSLPKDHDLKIWASLVNYSIDGRELSKQELNFIIERLPYDWWAPISSDILLKMLSNEESNEWLFSHPHPWPALVLRPIGELSNAPGLENLSHPGFNLEIYPLLVRRLRGRRGRDELPNSADSLLDLLDAIESSIDSNPPLTGRTHSLSGWLAQPIEKWPDFSSQIIFDGDPIIGERLLSRKTGFHENIDSINL
jgi:DNA-binding transcriptional ArsR family regulator